MFYLRFPRLLVRGPSTKPIAPGGDFSQKHSYPAFRRSLALRHVDTGSCQAVESELGLLASPTYDLSRFGVSFTPSPRHADVLLVTGVGTDAMLPVLKATYEAMPGPKAVVLVGDCARHGCGLARCDAPRQRIASVVPVDLEVPGCPPTPEAILQGLLALTGRGRRP